MQTDELIRDYVKRLDEAAATLSAKRRAELVDEVREHIDAAIAARGEPGEADVRNILERLGAPEEIVAAEFDTNAHGAAIPSAPMDRARFGLVEVAALMLVTIGAFALPLIGPAVGIGLTWMSSVWSPRQKALVTGLAVVVFVVPILGLAVSGASGSTLESTIGPVSP